MTPLRNLQIPAALAAFAVAAILLAAAAILSARPASAQIAAAAEPCTTVVISSRVISETRDGQFVDQRQIEDTVVDRCTTAAGGTEDRNRHRVRYWVDVQEFDSD